MHSIFKLSEPSWRLEKVSFLHGNGSLLSPPPFSNLFASYPKSTPPRVKYLLYTRWVGQTFCKSGKKLLKLCGSQSLCQIGSTLSWLQKAAIDHPFKSRKGCIPISLYLLKQVVNLIWSMGHSLPTPALYQLVINYV